MNNYKKTISELFKRTDFPHNRENNVLDLLESKKIILYGGGSGFITFSTFILKKYELAVSAILDRKFKSGDKFHGIPAFSPLEYKPTRQEKNKGVVVITVGKKKYHEEIFNSLYRLGFKNIILATDIYEYHLHYSSKELEKNGFDYFLQNRNKIIECLDIFADDLSCEIYVKFIQTHMLRKPINIPHRPLNEQYFPKDIKQAKKMYLRFVNCGAYHGETIRQCNRLYGKLDLIVCFEPDLQNFKSLKKYLSANSSKLAKSIIAFPCGIFSHETQLHFSGGYGSNSTISTEGNSIIQCVALDDVMIGFEPTFITMDIEGAELEALKGTEHLIKKNRPNLAISVYHSPNHIWDIPLYINSLKLGFQFYLRNYTSFISETILYAIIK